MVYTQGGVTLTNRGLNITSPYDRVWLLVPDSSPRSPCTNIGWLPTPTADDATNNTSELRVTTSPWDQLAQLTVESHATKNNVSY